MKIEDLFRILPDICSRYFRHNKSSTLMIVSNVITILLYYICHDRNDYGNNHCNE